MNTSDVKSNKWMRQSQSEEFVNQPKQRVKNNKTKRRSHYFEVSVNADNETHNLWDIVKNVYKD